MPATSGISDGSERIDPKFVNILWASMDDAAEMALMHEQMFEKNWDLPTLASAITDPASTAFLARIGPPLVTVGFVIARFAADEAEILTLGVAPNARNRGIGSQLVQGLVRAAKQAEIKRLFLEVAASNEAAIRLYRHLQFQDVDQRPGYDPSAKTAPEDARIMALDL